MEQLLVQIGGRLSAEIEQKYGSLKKAADAMGLKTGGAHLRPYLIGESKPGMSLRSKMRDAGLDVVYIMTGKRDSHINDVDVKKSFDDLQERLESLSSDLQRLSKSITNKDL
jgi:hypothetical protein